MCRYSCELRDVCTLIERALARMHVLRVYSERLHKHTSTPTHSATCTCTCSYQNNAKVPNMRRCLNVVASTATYLSLLYTPCTIIHPYVCPSLSLSMCVHRTRLCVSVCIINTFIIIFILTIDRHAQAHTYTQRQTSQYEGKSVRKHRSS